jgi:hypothetical protein
MTAPKAVDRANGAILAPTISAMSAALEVTDSARSEMRRTFFMMAIMMLTKMIANMSKTAKPTAKRITNAVSTVFTDPLSSLYLLNYKLMLVLRNWIVIVQYS